MNIKSFLWQKITIKTRGRCKIRSNFATNSIKWLKIVPRTIHGSLQFHSSINKRLMQVALVIHTLGIDYLLRNGVQLSYERKMNIGENLYLYIYVCVFLKWRITETKVFQFIPNLIYVPLFKTNQQTPLTYFDSISSSV
jgi:hypothetical protein